MLLLGFLIAYLLSVLILLLISPSAALLGALPFLVPIKFDGLVIVFLSVPIAVAVFFVALLVRTDLTGAKNVRWWWPIPASLMFLVAFFLVAEVCSSVLMRIQAFTAKPECLHLHSFFRSVQSLDSRDIEHGLYAKDGKIYLWSYKQLRFLPATYATGACLKQSAQGNQKTSTGGVAFGASGQQGLTPHSTGLPAAAR